MLFRESQQVEVFSWYHLHYRIKWQAGVVSQRRTTNHFLSVKLLLNVVWSQSTPGMLSVHPQVGYSNMGSKREFLFFALWYAESNTSDPATWRKNDSSISCASDTDLYHVNMQYCKCPTPLLWWRDKSNNVSYRII